MIGIRSILIAAAMAVADPAVAASSGPPSQVDVSGFADAVHHWANRYGSDYPRYRPDQIRQIADNILLLQRDHGGWVENRDPLRILTDAEIMGLIAEKADPRGSFDNRNVFPQITFLMGAYEALGDERYRHAALEGLDYLLRHQMDGCGGWPHTVPATESYHPLLTIADDVTSGPLAMLRLASRRAHPFATLDEAAAEQAAKAVRAGDACLLRLQIRQGNTLAGWAGQYDPATLTASRGRAFEPAAIASWESVEILRYLMSIEDPSAEIITSIESGVEWLRAVAIEGKRIEEYDLAAPVRFDYHTASTDRRLIDDSGAPLLWARFYDAESSEVVLSDRHGGRVARYEDISQERRTGYQWFGDWPSSLLADDYPRWRCRIGLDDCP